MKIVASSDWRDGLEYDRPVLVSDLVPGEPTHCFVCGPDAEPRPRTELWAVKHRHPKNPSGYVRFYCVDHRPAMRQAPVAAASAPVRPGRSSSGSGERRSAPKRPTVPDRVRAMCPDCFIEVSATGVCGNCGLTVG